MLSVILGGLRFSEEFVPIVPPHLALAIVGWDRVLILTVEIRIHSSRL